LPLINIFCKKDSLLIPIAIMKSGAIIPSENNNIIKKVDQRLCEIEEIVIIAPIIGPVQVPSDNPEKIPIPKTDDKFNLLL